jgi:3-oxoacyl-[acyl-carrier-protein] synthase II
MRATSRPDSGVAVTGLGALTSLGRDVPELLASFLAGRSGIRRAGDRLSTPAFQPRSVAALEDPAWRDLLMPPLDDEGAGLDPCIAVALPAAREAWRDAGLDRAGPPAARIAIVLGSSSGGLLSRSIYERALHASRERRHRLLHRADLPRITRALAAAFGIEGPSLSVSTACSSSTHALVHARELLLAGLADVVVVGGVEALVEEVFGGFHAMGAMSPSACAPFSLPIGMTLGEGAGFAILERPEDAVARGARARCFVVGTGLSADGWHPTAPDPSGVGISHAMRRALLDANLSPDAIDYLNAHGTGTDANDVAEWHAIERTFGAHAARLPVSSSKGHFGHTLGAAGILELIATVVCLERGVLPPTLHWSGPRGAGPLDPVPGPRPRASAARVALKSSSGFGGANAAIAISMLESVRAPTHTASDVWILGSGVVGPFGCQGYDGVLRRGAPTWSAPSSSDTTTAVGRVPALPMARLARGVDLRGMPALARHLLAAGSLALADAGLHLRGDRRERAGLFVSTWRPAWDATRAFWGSIRERGIERLAAPAFGQLVLNASAGIVAAGLGLRGPQTVLADRRGGALAALVLARQALALRRDADLLLVGSASEASDEALEDHSVEFPEQPTTLRAFDAYDPSARGPVLGEGAACVVVGAARLLTADGPAPLARVAGTGAACTGALARALADALSDAGWQVGDVDGVYGSADGRAGTGARELEALREVLGDRAAEVPLFNPAPIVGASASLDAFALAASVEALRCGELHLPAGWKPVGAPRAARRVVVLADDELTGSWAIALEARELPFPATR